MVMAMLRLWLLSLGFAINVATAVAEPIAPPIQMTVEEFLAKARAIAVHGNLTDVVFTENTLGVHLARREYWTKRDGKRFLFRLDYEPVELFQPRQRPSLRSFYGSEGGSV